MYALLRIILYFALTLLSLPALWAMVWKVTKGEDTFYVVGVTHHRMDTKDDVAKLMAEIKDVQEITFEIDIWSDATKAKLEAVQIGAGTCQISNDLKSDLDSFLTSKGAPREGVNELMRIHPFELARLLDNMQRIDTTRGEISVEAYLADHIKKTSIKRDHLETADEMVFFYKSFTDLECEKILRESVLGIKGSSNRGLRAPWLTVQIGSIGLGTVMGIDGLTKTLLD